MRCPMAGWFSCAPKASCMNFSSWFIHRPLRVGGVVLLLQYSGTLQTAFFTCSYIRVIVAVFLLVSFPFFHVTLPVEFVSFRPQVQLMAIEIDRCYYYPRMLIKERCLQAIMLGLLGVSAPVIYHRRKRNFATSGMTRLPTSARF